MTSANYAVADSVITDGVLHATGGIRFPDNSLQTSACSGCVNVILPITLGGTGANNATDARTNLHVPGLQTPNYFTYDQTVAGTVNASSFSGNGSGLTSLNASSLSSGTVPDARLPSNLATKYGKVAVVAVSGGDYTNPAVAMAGYASWCGTPSETNPCLLKIMPGVYDIGTSSVVMQPYIDIEGSRENSTVITGSVVSDSSSDSNGIVNGANNAEIRFLTVKNTGSGNYVTAVCNMGASPRMTNMTADVSGEGDHSGVLNYDSSPVMTNVTATASGGISGSYGVHNSYSSPVMTNVTATASGAGTNIGVYNPYSSPVMTDVTATASGGTTCFGVYNGSSSPSMTGVTATASGGTTCFGVFNGSSSPSMNDVTATASGGTSSCGVYNVSSSPAMGNVTATASGGTTSCGVYNVSSSPAMSNVTATASGGSSNYGLYNSAPSGAYTIKIDRSTFTGSTNSICNDSHFTLRIGASNLTGGAVNAVGTYTCVGVYDGDTYAALNATCQ